MNVGKIYIAEVTGTFSTSSMYKIEEGTKGILIKVVDGDSTSFLSDSLFVYQADNLNSIFLKTRDINRNFKVFSELETKIRLMEEEEKENVTSALKNLIENIKNDRVIEEI